MQTWAVITGASSGIGAAFAPALAARGFNLVLVARREARLKELAGQLQRAHPVTVEVLAADLTEPGACERLAAALPDETSALVNNAGFGCAGEAIEGEVPKQLQVIDLNVRALTELSLRVAPRLEARGGGHILNVGSVVGFFPVPYLAVYAATKAYVLSFSEALDYELAGRGVRCHCLCPGATASEFYDVAEDGERRIRRPDGLVMSCEEVAQEGLALMDGRRSTRIAGWMNSLLALPPRVLPRRWMTRLSAQFTPARPER